MSYTLHHLTSHHLAPRTIPPLSFITTSHFQHHVTFTFHHSPIFNIPPVPTHRPATRPHTRHSTPARQQTPSPPHSSQLAITPTLPSFPHPHTRSSHLSPART
ncbi:hypothetical protein E2C01_037971 [Portunus trituberculatus]|uniref:Uncharacterized protein n=1 Tax=Portunus trituberculatus TaxID=210409 RepID=A0A5B7FGD2_PORTR|nr:hypothetical protein [Portunus trituberculatus]